MPLATMTMKTQAHGFLNFYPCTIVMGLRSEALWAARELRYKLVGFWLCDITFMRFSAFQHKEPIATLTEDVKCVFKPKPDLLNVRFRLFTTLHIPTTPYDVLFCFPIILTCVSRFVLNIILWLRPGNPVSFSGEICHHFEY